MHKRLKNISLSTSILEVNSGIWNIIVTSSSTHCIVEHILEFLKFREFLEIKFFQSGLMVFHISFVLKAKKIIFFSTASFRSKAIFVLCRDGNCFYLSIVFITIQAEYHFARQARKISRRFVYNWGGVL